MFGTILALLIVATFIIMYFVLKSEIKNLRKANTGLLQANTKLVDERNTELKQLENYLTQDPIAAFQLLQAHVTGAKKNRR